jgi:ADP-heptose:LPS heptosyltransferase
VQKLLIIRFSSLGDIAQALTAAQALKGTHAGCSIHWVTRADFTEFVKSFSSVDQVWSFERRAGFLGLIRLGIMLRREKYDFVYDAHSNVRSRILSVLLWRPSTLLVRRSKERWKRFLLFKMRLNTFEMPYRGALSYLSPIARFVTATEQAPYLDIKSQPAEALTDTKSTILLAPSAAWELKKWPTEYWLKLIQLLNKNLPNYKLALIGGPEDNFESLMATGYVQNLAGKLSWKQTAYAIKNSPLLISGDTGALHVGDGLKVKTVAIIGPTAFGHPSRVNSLVAEQPLYCRPCTKDGRGKCYNDTFKKCLIEVTPETVLMKAQHLLEVR